MRPAYPRTPRPTPARQICTSLNVAEIGAGGLSPSGLSIVPVKEDRQRSRGLAATFLAVLVRVSRLQAPVQGFHNGQWPGPNLNPVSQCPCQSWDHGPLYHLRLRDWYIPAHSELILSLNILYSLQLLYTIARLPHQTPSK